MKEIRKITRPVWRCEHCGQDLVGWVAVADHRDEFRLKHDSFNRGENKEVEIEVHPFQVMPVRITGSLAY